MKNSYLTSHPIQILLHLKRIKLLRSHSSAPDAQNINRVFHYCKSEERQSGEREGDKGRGGGCESNQCIHVIEFRIQFHIFLLEKGNRILGTFSSNQIIKCMEERKYTCTCLTRPV